MISTAPTAPIKKPTAILLHPLMQSIAQRGIRFTATLHNFGDEAHPNMKPVALIEGFSKAGTALVFADGDMMQVVTSGELTVIEDFDDLVAIAYDWWYRYHTCKSFETPHIMWLPHFLSRGWVQEVQTTTYKASR